MERRKKAIVAGHSLLAVLLVLGMTGPVASVQLPAAQLPVGAPMQLPDSLPLQGLEGWRLRGVFYQDVNHGWVMLSTREAGSLRVEKGALVQDGIYLEAIEREGVWLARGQYRAYLKLSGSLQLSRPVEKEARPNAASAMPTEPCQMLAASGAPLDELRALGICPGAE